MKNIDISKSVSLNCFFLFVLMGALVFFMSLGNPWSLLILVPGRWFGVVIVAANVIVLFSERKKKKISTYDIVFLIINLVLVAGLWFWVSGWV